MIRREGDYLVCDEPCSPVSQLPPAPAIAHSEKASRIEGKGSIDDRLSLIRNQIGLLQKQKLARLKHYSGQDLLQSLKHSTQQTTAPLSIQLSTPLYLSKLIERVEDLQQKIGKAELYNQTVHRKGNLTARLKVIQEKIKRLSQIPMETVVRNITNFNSLTEDRDEQLKYLFVYEQFLKTQGMKDEYRVVKEYLSTLKTLHQESAMAPAAISKLLTLHHQVVDRAATTQTEYEQIYRQIETDFKALNQELQKCTI